MAELDWAAAFIEAARHELAQRTPSTVGRRPSARTPRSADRAAKLDTEIYFTPWARNRPSTGPTSVAATASNRLWLIVQSTLGRLALR